MGGVTPAHAPQLSPKTASPLLQLRASGARNLWTILSGPETLFFLATAQALLPYLLWHLHGLNPDYDYDLSYIPVIIYVLGYFAFLVGTRVARALSRYGRDGYYIPPERLKPCLLLITAGAFLQFCLAAKLYGGIPIFNYLRQTTDVWEVNALQSNSFMGQLGLLTLTTFFMSTVAMLVLVKATRSSLFTILLVVSSAVLCFLISSMAGKRQGLLVSVFIVAGGIMTRSGDPLRSLISFLGFSPRFQSSFLLSSATLVVCLGFCIAYLTILGGLRTGENVAPVELVKYLEFPLINFESQAEVFGFGPQRYDAVALLAGLLPKKIVDSSETLFFDKSFYPEPTASAGVYGPLHLYSGFGGCIIFAFLLGAFCKYAHIKAKNSDLYLMIYAQCCWPLFVSYSFNLFLYVVFVVGPIAAYWAFYFFLKCTSKQNYRPLRYANGAGGT